MAEVQFHRPEPFYVLTLTETEVSLILREWEGPPSEYAKDINQLMAAIAEAIRNVPEVV